MSQSKMFLSIDKISGQKVVKGRGGRSLTGRTKNFDINDGNSVHTARLLHMGQFLQGGKNYRLMSFFF